MHWRIIQRRGQSQEHLDITRAASSDMQGALLSSSRWHSTHQDNCYRYQLNYNMAWGICENQNHICSVHVSGVSGNGYMGCTVGVSFNNRVNWNIIYTCPRQHLKTAASQWDVQGSVWMNCTNECHLLFYDPWRMPVSLMSFMFFGVEVVPWY